MKGFLCGLDGALNGLSGVVLRGPCLRKLLNLASHLARQWTRIGGARLLARIASSQVNLFSFSFSFFLSGEKERREGLKSCTAREGKGMCVRLCVCAKTLVRCIYILLQFCVEDLATLGTQFRPPHIYPHCCCTLDAFTRLRNLTNEETMQMQWL